MEYSAKRKNPILSTFLSTSTDPFGTYSIYKGSYCINSYLKNSMLLSLQQNYYITSVSVKGGEYIDYYNWEQFTGMFGKKVLVYDKLQDILYVKENVDSKPNLIFDGKRLLLIEMIGGSKSVMELSALSGIKNNKGAYSYDPLPNGEYYVNHPYRRSDVKGMIREKVGYSMDIIPKFTSIKGVQMKRTELRIHPDGNNPGSAGCIALGVDKDALNTFYVKMQQYIKQFGQVDLSVYDKANPNVMHNRHLGKKSIGE